MNRVVASAFTIFLIFTNQLLACNCVGTANPKEAIRNTDQIFKANVLSEKYLSIPFEFAGQKAGINMEFKQFTLQIEKTYKGKIKHGKITITTGIGHGDCGFAFQVNQEYVVYANWRHDYYTDGPQIERYLFTDICKRTTSQVDQEVKTIKASRRCRER